MKLDLKKIKLEGATTGSSVKNKSERPRHLIDGEENLRMLLKKYRKKNKMTQEEVATFSNLSRLAVNEFEAGKTDIRLSTFFKLLKAYGFEMELKE